MNDPRQDFPGTVVDTMRSNGSWNPLWDGLDALDPHWTEQYMQMAMGPYRSELLTPREVQLLCIAVDANATHMYAPGVRRHIRAALDLGVEPEVILEVLKLSTTVGIHACNLGVPILVEEMARANGDAMPAPGGIASDAESAPGIQAGDTHRRTSPGPSRRADDRARSIPR